MIIELVFWIASGFGKSQRRPRVRGRRRAGMEALGLVALILAILAGVWMYNHVWHINIPVRDAEGRAVTLAHFKATHGATTKRVWTRDGRLKVKRLGLTRLDVADLRFRQAAWQGADLPKAIQLEPASKLEQVGRGAVVAKDLLERWPGRER